MPFKISTAEDTHRQVGALPAQDQRIVKGEEFHAHQNRSLSRLEADLRNRLNECAESGQTLVVELPGGRLLAIQALDPHEDDTLMDELLATNPRFQTLVARSKASPRKPFVLGDRRQTDA